MNWVIPTVLIFISMCLVFICFMLFFQRKAALASAPSKGKTLPVSKTPIKLSMFDEICKKEGTNGKIDFQPISEEDNNAIRELFKRQESLTPKLIKQNPPIKIAYTNVKDEKTVRDIIPYRVVGSVDVDESDGTKEYNFFIEAYCLLRNQERSFHTNGVSAAWHQGRENNLGDYLMDLYRRSKSA